MKKFFLTVLAGYSIVSAGAQDKGMAPFSTYSFAGKTISSVESETSGGNIRLENVAGKQTGVDVFVTPANRRKNGNISQEELKTRLADFYTLEVVVEGNQLKAIARPKNRKYDHKNALSISFRIYVPQTVTSRLSTSGGNIDIQHLNGEQNIQTSGGNLVISDVKGKLKGTTSGGNIHVTDAHDDIQLTTSGGDIVSGNCKGNIKLVTSGGSIMLNNISGNADASTSGGNVKVEGARGDLQAFTSGGNIDINGLSGNLSTGTSGGDVQVAVTEPGKSIKIRNSGGNISLQLPAGKGYDFDLNANKISKITLANFNGKMDDHQITGQVNGGGSRVQVEGNHGNLSLMLK